MRSELIKWTELNWFGKIEIYEPINPMIIIIIKKSVSVPVSTHTATTFVVDWAIQKKINYLSIAVLCNLKLQVL